MTNSTSTVCVICYDNYPAPQTGTREVTEASMTTLACGHSFHFGCIDTWLLRVHNCPYCRTPITPPLHFSWDPVARRCLVSSRTYIDVEHVSETEDEDEDSGMGLDSENDPDLSFEIAMNQIVRDHRRDEQIVRLRALEERVMRNLGALRRVLNEELKIMEEVRSIRNTL